MTALVGLALMGFAFALVIVGRAKKSGVQVKFLATEWRQATYALVIVVSGFSGFVLVCNALGRLFM